MDPIVFAVGLLVEAWAALGHPLQWGVVLGAVQWVLLAVVDCLTTGRQRRCSMRR